MVCYDEEILHRFLYSRGWALENGAYYKKGHIESSELRSFIVISNATQRVAEAFAIECAEMDQDPESFIFQLLNKEQDEKSS